MGGASPAVKLVSDVEGGAVASWVGLLLLSLRAEREPRREGWGRAGGLWCGGP